MALSLQAYQHVYNQYQNSAISRQRGPRSHLRQFKSARWHISSELAQFFAFAIFSYLLKCLSSSFLQKKKIYRPIIPCPIIWAAIASRKATKNRTHFDSCQAEGIFFQPLVVETFGGWDKEAIDFLKKIATKGSRRWGLTNAVAIKQFFQRLSIELQRGNAALLIERDTDTGV